MGTTPKKPLWIIGIDEVGRGPLAGPVTVCAVAMKCVVYEKRAWLGLTDSKKLSAKRREAWYQEAKELEKKGVLRIAVVSETAKQIDDKGIAVCIRSCIAKTLTQLQCDPKTTLVLLDGGLKAPDLYINQQTIIRGDQSEQIISMASVVAKVTRDAYMTRISDKYLGYGWAENKGYGTKSHQKSLKKLGFTRLHRKSFLSRILDNKT
jgi:ribonuclease HII